MSTIKDLKVEEDIQRLKEWLQKQPHLPQDVDMGMLTAYVCGTKSTERAKEKLENYFLCKSIMPIYFTFPGRDPEDAAFKRGCEAMKVFILPKTTKEGYTVVMGVLNLDFSMFNQHQLIARMTMLVDLVLLERPDMQDGLFICDCKGLEASIIPKLSTSASAFYFSWFEKAIPMKLKNMIFFNAPKFMDIIVNNFVKPFLSQKICSRMVVTTEDVSITMKTIPEHILPRDYGGKEKSSTDLNNYWLEKLRKNREWFKKTTEQVVNETLRLPDGKNTFGLNGTFRSINVD